MVEKIIKGKAYRVIDDDAENFKSGDIVIALENDNIPYCMKKDIYEQMIQEKEFKEYFEKDLIIELVCTDSYREKTMRALTRYELEEI